MIETNIFIPSSLKALPVWGLWRLEPDKNGRETKVPYSALYHGRASSTNPETWTTFDKALAKFVHRMGDYKGIALAISKEYSLVFIDIDHCVDEEGHFSETASDIIGLCKDQFVELSQSGTGVHIIARGTIPRNFKDSKTGVEMYSDKRFCAITGNAIFQNEPCENQSAIDEIFERYKTTKAEIKPARSQNIALNVSDNWIVEHASRRGKFKELYCGRWSGLYESQSEADLSLCLILAFWCNCDVEQMDRIFRASGLYRDKWEREDYRTSTLSNAINICRETYSEYRERRSSERERIYREMWES